MGKLVNKTNDTGNYQLSPLIKQMSPPSNERIKFSSSTFRELHMNS